MTETVANKRPGMIRFMEGTLFSDTVNTGGGADEEVFSGDGGGGHAHVVFGESIGVEEFEGLARFADVGAAVFVEAEDFSLVSPRGGGESGGAGEALFTENFGPGFGVEGGEVAAVEEDVELVLVEEGGGVVRGGLPVAPGNEFVGGVL